MNTSVANLVLPMVVPQAASGAAASKGLNAGTAGKASKQTPNEGRQASEAQSDNPRNADRAQQPKPRRRAEESDVQRADSRKSTHGDGKAKGKSNEKRADFADVLNAAQQAETAPGDQIVTEQTQAAADMAAMLNASLTPATAARPESIGAQGETEPLTVQPAAAPAGIDVSLIVATDQLAADVAQAAATQEAATADQAAEAAQAGEAEAVATGGEQTSGPLAIMAEGEEQAAEAPDVASELEGEAPTERSEAQTQQSQSKMTQAEQLSAEDAARQRAAADAPAEVQAHLPRAPLPQRRGEARSEAVRPSAKPVAPVQSHRLANRRQDATSAAAAHAENGLDAVREPQGRARGQQADFALQGIYGGSAATAPGHVQSSPGDASTLNADHAAVASPGEQITEAVRSAAASGEQRVVIRLDPPELGQVRVILRAEGNQVRGVVQVDNQRTLDQLRHESPSLLSRLAEAGIEVRRMELGFTPGSGGESMPQWNLRQDGGAWGGAGGRDGRQASSGEAGNGESPLAGDEQQQSAATSVWDGAINVWI